MCSDAKRCSVMWCDVSVYLVMMGNIGMAFRRSHSSEMNEIMWKFSWCRLPLLLLLSPFVVSVVFLIYMNVSFLQYSCSYPLNFWLGLPFHLNSSHRLIQLKPHEIFVGKNTRCHFCSQPTHWVHASETVMIHKHLDWTTFSRMHSTADFQHVTQHLPHVSDVLYFLIPDEFSTYNFGVRFSFTFLVDRFCFRSFFEFFFCGR